MNDEKITGVPHEVFYKEYLKSLPQKRKERLEKEGLAGWFGEIESQVNNGVIPSLTEEEGKLVSERFSQNGVDLKDLKPTQPSGSEETPVMEAIDQDLAEVFGEGISEKIETFVEEKVVPLRHKPPKNNKFLIMATKNIIRDVIALGRTFQLSDEQYNEIYPEVDPNEMRQAALENLGVSMLTRILKGNARNSGFTSKNKHIEHIWHIRGVRDVPPRSPEVLGAFIDGLLSEGTSGQVETSERK